MVMNTVLSQGVRFLTWLCCCLLPLVLSLSGCKEQPPLKIGYVGGLTGRVSGLGIAGRDALLLAVEEVNARGGVNGQQVILITRDDQQQAEIAQQAIKELVDSGVVAIIGPMTSSMAMAMHPLASSNQIALISPTVTTNQLSDSDDYFFRLTLPLKTNAEKTAEYALSHGLNRFAITIETGNAAFTEDWYESFRKLFEAGGGQIVYTQRFKSGEEGGGLQTAERLLKENPDAVLLLGGAMDVALTAQQLRKLGSQAQLFSSEWGFTSDVITFGGGAVEGMLCFVTYDPGSDAPAHQEFLRSFETRFGYRPSFAAVLSYESAKLLFTGLRREPSRKGLRQALLEVGTIEGLQGDVRINRYGDAERQTYLGTVQGGQFVTLR